MQKKMLSLLAAAAVTTSLLVACNNSAKTETKVEDTASKMEPTTPVEEKGVMVGGANMVPSKDIVDNAVNSADHTTLVAAVKAAELVETLKSAGPFTVFAPTNEAFGKLPAGTIADVISSNGVTYVIDAVLMPKK
jgi:uncharacterized surface protein with fasciclin (FAS1) repeats